MQFLSILCIMSSILFYLKIPSDPVQMPRAMGSLEVQVCVCVCRVCVVCVCCVCVCIVCVCVVCVCLCIFVTDTCYTVISDGSLVTWE